MATGPAGLRARGGRVWPASLAAWQHAPMHAPRTTRLATLTCCGIAVLLAAGCPPQRAAVASPPPAPAAPAPAPAPPPAAGESWNAEQIRWLPYEEGLRAAAAEGKPVCLVFYTTWCGHCRNYSKVFDDARVVELARRFVMIRLDKDRNAELSRRYAPDGEYIPRTFFLASDGRLDPSIAAPRPNYRYFYDEQRAEGLLAGMQQALQKLR